MSLNIIWGDNDTIIVDCKTQKYKYFSKTSYEIVNYITKSRSQPFCAKPRD
jgi:hypothetical protein